MLIATGAVGANALADPQRVRAQPGDEGLRFIDGNANTAARVRPRQMDTPAGRDASAAGSPLALLADGRGRALRADGTGG